MYAPLPPSVLKTYLTEKFPDFQSAGREFRVNSIFKPDGKYKMYINLDNGLWTDFKSGEKGNFIQLVSHVESLDYKTAAHYVRKIAYKAGGDLFNLKPTIENKPIEVARTIEKDKRDWFPVHPSRDIKSPSKLVRDAAQFARSRKLTSQLFFVGSAGKYYNRIIIPYFNKNDEVFYFQARSLDGKEPKYLNPSKALYGIKTSEILYPFDERKDYVVVAEGPLDAMSLRAAGFNSTCTQGSKMSVFQARALKGKKVILAYDNDTAGMQGTSISVDKLLAQRNSNIYYLRPPCNYKDWNEFWMVSNQTEFGVYVTNNLRSFDFEERVNAGFRLRRRSLPNH